MADQSAAATQAGLSTDGESQDADPAFEPQTEAKSQPSTTNQAAQSPSAAPVLPPPPQLATAATQAAPPAVTAPTRAGTSTLSRTSDAEASAQPSSLGAGAPSPTELSPAPTTDIQAAPPTPSPMIATMAAGPTTSTRPPQAASPAPSPATQVAQAIAEPVKVIMTSPPQTEPTTPHVTTIQITPVELGRVEVRIERSTDGPAKIQLVAERPETLSRLVHDQSQLQQALDHAGIPQNSRTIEFSLAPAATDGNAFSSNLSGNTASGGESSNNGSPRQNSAYHNQAFNGIDDVNLASATQSRVIRTGIDITA